MPRGAIRWCLLASLMLSGCNSLPIVKDRPVAPPVQYIQDCPEPIAQKPLTNSALGQYAIDAREVIRLCNTDKAALREWASKVKND
jgi:hypothetical protein